MNGTNPVTTITAPAGFVITKVAIKSGSNSFAVPSPDNVDPGDDNTGDQHSGVIYVNGTYGLGNGFTVAGLGTGVVTVTKNAGTKDISHVDYMLGVAPTGTISGKKFNDIDGDGTDDGGTDRALPAGPSSSTKTPTAPSMPPLQPGPAAFTPSPA